MMSAEKANNLLDAVEDGAVGLEPWRERDLAILEVLYGCGLRVSELVGLDLTDLALDERSMRVRGKGNKERQVPIGTRAVEAVQRYLDVRPEKPGQHALFLNSRSDRLGDRQVRRLVKNYALLAAGDSTVHPHSFPACVRHAPAQRWCGFESDSGTARSRPPHNYSEIHAGVLARSASRLRQSASEGIAARRNSGSHVRRSSDAANGFKDVSQR